LLDPPVKSSTYVLWFGPVVIFLLALFGVFLFMRRSRIVPVATAASLNAEEEVKLKKLLDDTQEGNS